MSFVPLLVVDVLRTSVPPQKNASAQHAHIGTGVSIERGVSAALDGPSSPPSVLPPTTPSASATAAAPARASSASGTPARAGTASPPIQRLPHQYMARRATGSSGESAEAPACSSTGASGNDSSNSQQGRSRCNAELPAAPAARRSRTWGAKRTKSHKYDGMERPSVRVDAAWSPAAGCLDVESAGAPIRRARSYSTGVEERKTRARVCNMCTSMFAAASTAGVPPPSLLWSSMPSAAAARGGSGAQQDARASRHMTSSSDRKHRRGLSFADEMDASPFPTRAAPSSAFVSASNSGLASADSSADDMPRPASGTMHDDGAAKRSNSSGAHLPKRHGAPPAHVLGHFLLSGVQQLQRHGSGSSSRQRTPASALRTTSHRDTSTANSFATVFAMSADSDHEAASDRIRRSGSGAVEASGRAHRASEDSTVWPVSVQHVSSAEDGLFTRSNTQPSAPPSPAGHDSPTFAGRYSRPASSEREVGSGIMGGDTSDPDNAGIRVFDRVLPPFTGPNVVVLPGVHTVQGVARLGTPPTPERILSEAISLSSGKDGGHDAERICSLNLDTVSDGGLGGDDGDLGGPSMLQRAVSTESCDDGRNSPRASGHMDPTPPNYFASPIRSRTGPLPARDSRMRSISGGGGAAMVEPTQPMCIPQDKTEPLFAVDRDGNRTSAGLRTRRNIAPPLQQSRAGLPMPALVARRHKTDMGPRGSLSDLGTGYFDAEDAAEAALARFREKRAVVAAANVEAALASGVLSPQAVQREKTAEYTTTYTCSNCQNVFAPALSGFQHYCSRDCHTMATLHGVSAVAHP